MRHKGVDGVKRGIFPDSRIRLVQSVEREYELFKYKTLSKSRNEIFEECGIIRFYSCIYEYFHYTQDMEAAHIRACLKCGEYVIETLYRLYLKYGYLRYSCWEDIEELLDVLVREQEDGTRIMP